MPYSSLGGLEPVMISQLNLPNRVVFRSKGEAGYKCNPHSPHQFGDWSK